MARNPRIGIISFAHMHAYSYAHALNVSGDIDFAGVADADGARGQKAALDYGTTYYASSHALLDANLDGVIIASENIHHRPLTEQCAAAGIRAILCEKPLATTVDDGQAMVDACTSAGVHLFTAFPCRFSPVFAEVRKLVEEGGLGEIIAIRGTNRGRNPGGWFIEKALSGGGAVIDHTVHVADLNRVLLGREAVEVYAEIDNRMYHGNFDDTGFLTVTYDNGAFATIDTSWSRPKTYPNWGDVALQIMGSGGVADVDLFAQAVTHYDDPGRSVAWQGWGSNIDALMIAEFARFCRGENATALATGLDGLRATQVALAAYRSADAKQPVAV
jgi:predicted dehydrogenase